MKQHRFKTQSIARNYSQTQHIITKGRFILADELGQVKINYIRTSHVMKPSSQMLTYANAALYKMHSQQEVRSPLITTDVNELQYTQKACHSSPTTLFVPNILENFVV